MWYEKKKHLIIIRIYCCTKIVTIKYRVIRLLIHEASILCLHIWIIAQTILFYGNGNENTSKLIKKLTNIFYYM